MLLATEFQAQLLLLQKFGLWSHSHITSRKGWGLSIFAIKCGKRGLGYFWSVMLHL